MKFNKKTIIFLAFVIGALTFVTTAFADMALGSGYDSLKDSLKHTTSQMAQGLDNFTLDGLGTVKDNGKVLYQSSGNIRVDNVKAASETTTTNLNSKGKTTSDYNYRDALCDIRRNPEETDKYYMTQYEEPMEKPLKGVFPNPFDNEGAGEIEKIFDALVGNLKSYVEVQDKPEGGREYSGNISEEQVPALVNAVTSFAFKRTLMGSMVHDENVQLSEIKSDLCIKKASGKAVENKSGLLENLTGDIVLSGRDKNGVQHDLEFEFLVKLYDIGTTTVSKPDLTGKEVKIVKNYPEFGSKYIGKYKNDIILEKDDQFVKIGERTLEITGANGKTVSGHYYETFKPGFEEYSAGKYDFTFDMNASSSNSTFTYKNASGETETGQLHMGGNGKVYLNLDVEVVDKNTFRVNGDRTPYFDGELIRAFQD